MKGMHYFSIAVLTVYHEVIFCKFWNPIDFILAQNLTIILAQFQLPILNQKRGGRTLCFKRMKEVWPLLVFLLNHMYKTFAGMCLCMHYPCTQSKYTCVETYFFPGSLVSSFHYAQVRYFPNLSLRCLCNFKTSGAV